MRITKTLLAGSLLVGAGSVQAADHLDSPSVQAEAGADINDLYAFVTPNDPDTITLIMTVNPLATDATTFSDAVDFTFKVQRLADGEMRDITCNVDAGNFTCTGPSGAVATGPVGATASGDSIDAWAGLRDDPFFFDLAAFQNAVGANDDATPFCLLREGDDGTDFFATLNVMAFAVEIRKEVLLGADAPANQTLAIWATTTRRGGN